MGWNLSQLAADWLADPTHRDWYLLFCSCLLVLPMVGLSIWYHWNVRRSALGKRLMKRQGGANPGAPGSLKEGTAMARDIANGKYGAHVRRLQSRTYWLVALWVLACALAFGILIAADEVNRPAGP